MRRRVAAAAALILTVLLAGCTGPTSSPTTGPSAEQASGSSVRDFSGAVDIGAGRDLFLECRGAGSPTVILESGIHDSSDYWVNVQPNPPAVGPDVFAVLSAHTRVCRYDRPGTLVPSDTGAVITERSTSVANPRTINEVNADLESLIDAAELEPPFLLVGHSFGGWLQLNFAQNHQEDVVGLVLVDAFSDRLPQLMGDKWEAYYSVLNSLGGNPLEDDPASERYDVPTSVAQAATAPPLPDGFPMVVLSKTEPFPIPTGTQGFTGADLEAAWLEVQAGLAGLVPNTPHIIAQGSDHYIQVREPDLVTDAILLVLDRVRGAQ